MPASTKSKPKSRSASGGSSRRGTGSQLVRWGARAAVAIVAGLGVGVAAGVSAVNHFEPGRANSVDSLAVMLDSVSKGSISGSGGRSATSSATQAEPANSASLPSDSATLPISGAEGAAASGADSSRPLVPSVIGLEEGSARAAILAAGLQVGEVQFTLSGKPAGTVLATSPNGGTPVEPGHAITLILSDGRGTPLDTIPAIAMDQAANRSASRPATPKYHSVVSSELSRIHFR